MKKYKLGKIALSVAGVLTGIFVFLHAVGKKKRKKTEKDIDEGNKYLEKKDGEDRNEFVHKASGYEKRIKPFIDTILSFGGLVLLSPIYGVIALAIKIDDPGPVLFTQKRIGNGKHFFRIHKFRSMNIGTTNLHQYALQYNQKSAFLAV